MSKRRVEMINGILYAADECWSCCRKKPRTIGESLENTGQLQYMDMYFSALQKIQ